MAHDDKTDLQLSNIPAINLLTEFYVWNREIRSDKFLEQFAVGYSQPIRTRLLIWNGDSSDLLTLILQRTILGLESYVWVAVWLALGESGRLTPELQAKVRNPFTIKRSKSGTAYCFYNALPALVDPTFALEQNNRILWEEIRGFWPVLSG